MNSNFTNPELVEKLKIAIKSKAKNLGQINLMEVCGTHTMAIGRFGIRDLLPKNINLLSGPGCPVCVCPNIDIDNMIALSKMPKVCLTTFGDMMRVPGSETSLLKEQARGANIKIVYSPIDAVKIAKENKDIEVVFLGVGFETTTPTSAAAIKQAKNLGLKNFSVYCAHKNMPGALELIANDKDVKIDGLILPGHVSTITGIHVFDFLASDYHIPGVVSGFDAVDIMHAIDMLVAQIESGQSKIENAYTRAVKDCGNNTALCLINEVFETCECTWRGLGSINNSGYKIKKEYAQFDASNRFDLSGVKSHENTGCQCGEVLRGIITPKECKLFSKVCNPENPIGPCMVSTEGSCSAYYKYNL